MSQGTACKCPRSGFVVDVRNGNYSAFNGYKWTPSRYSAVRCSKCGACWRTDAAYVRDLPDAPALESAVGGALRSDRTLREATQGRIYAQQSPSRFGLRPYDPICIVTKEPHQPREQDPARCRTCGLFIR